MSYKLIPPDMLRCQCEIRFGSFMTWGIAPYQRCYNKPVAIISQIGKKGRMTVCDSCLSKAKSEIKCIKIKFI